MTIPTHIAALLDRALGPQGYYGAFTANMHTDTRPLGRQRDRGGRSGPRRARHLGRADARLDRRPQQLVLRRARLRRRPPAVHAQAGHRRTRARGDGARAPHPPGALVGLTRNGVPVATSSARGQGDRVPGLPRRPRRLRRDLSGPTPAAGARGGGGRRPVAGRRRRWGGTGPAASRDAGTGGGSAGPARAGTARAGCASRGAGWSSCACSCPRERAALPRRSEAAARRRHAGAQEFPGRRRRRPAGCHCA